MKNKALDVHISARRIIVDLDVSEGERMQRMIQYCTEEMGFVENEMTAGIATIEHQRNVLEAIYQMAGKALGKL